LSADISRSKVPRRSDYREYREELRRDFHYACGYCTTKECEAEAIGFEIDHYLPLSGHPDLIADFLNLVWSCRHCNSYKSDWDPQDPKWKPEEVIFRPDQYKWSEHFKPVSGYEVAGVSPLGAFTCRHLRLNRPLLKRLREYRDRMHKAQEELKKRLQHLKRLARKIDLVPPKLRGKVMRLHHDLMDEAGQMETLLDEIIKQGPRSRLY